MNIETFRSFCLGFPGTTEEMPFDEHVLAFKVNGKLFALTNIDTFESITLKCDPETALRLRETLADVQPGYHMNKTHWNTIHTGGELTDKQLRHWIRHSYERVVAKLPKAQRETLREEYE